jgi:hypothetical protein
VAAFGRNDALEDPPRGAIPPRLARDDQLVAANALLAGAQDVAIVVGPAAGIVATPLGALALTVVGVRLGVLGGMVAVVGGVPLLRASHRLGAVPAARGTDPTTGSSRDTIALGGSAPG